MKKNKSKRKMELNRPQQDYDIWSWFLLLTWMK